MNLQAERRTVGDIDEERRGTKTVKFVDALRLALLKEREKDSCLELSNTTRLENLPTEILRTVIDLLFPSDIKWLSCASKHLREVCLPSLFRRVHFEFSKDGFEELKRMLQSDNRHYVFSFTYKVPNLLKTGKYLLQ
jgi:hypothetical protein